MPKLITGLDTQETPLYTADDLRVATRDIMEGEERWTLRSLSDQVVRAIDRVEEGTAETWTWTKDYVYRGSQLLGAHQADLDTAEVSDSERVHFHLDHLGTIRIRTDKDGGLIATERINRTQPKPDHHYFPFGEEPDRELEPDEVMKFTGHQRDFHCEGCVSPANDDLDYMLGRYYSAVVGRFLSVDPKTRRKGTRAPQSWNRYSYARGNPVKFLDPNGREIRLAEGGKNEAVRDFLVLVAMRPSGRAKLQQLAESTSFISRFEEKTITPSSRIRMQLRLRNEAAITFGTTSPRVRVEGGQTKIVGSDTRIDSTAITMFHSTDRSGVVTTAHEMFHVMDVFEGRVGQLEEGDMPSSATGPAEQFGIEIFEEDPDISREEAEEFIDEVVIFKG